MEKRLVLFFVLSTLIVVGHLFLQAKFAPPKPVAKPGALNAQGDKADDKPGDDEGPPVKDKPAESPEKPEVKTGDVKPTDEPPPVVPVKTVAPQWLALGSADPATGYRMLVTLTNRGAAVERIELSSPRFQDLEDKTGYLGHLALTNEPNGQGCRVSIVGPGTPAASAVPDVPQATNGLLVGDVIREFDGKAIANDIGFRNALATSKPGGQVKLTVQRGASTISFTVTLTKHPLEVVKPESEQLGGTGPDLPSFLLTLESLGSGKEATKIPVGEAEIGGLPSLHDAHWEASQPKPDEVEFRLQLNESQLRKIGKSGGLELIKRYRLSPTPPTDLEKIGYKSYHLELEIEIRRIGDTPLQVAYRLDGPNGLPLEGWWYSTKVHTDMFAAAGARDVIYNNTKNPAGYQIISCSKILGIAKKEPSEFKFLVEKQPPDERALRYLGVDTQYFAAMLLPKDAAEMPLVSLAQARAVGDVKNLKKGWDKTLNVSFQIATEPKMISADKPLKHEFVIFAGPKDKELLQQYQIGSLLYYGWWHYVVVALSWILYGFQSVVVNYGVAIVMLTVLVRSCMLPISFKMTKNSQKMQALAPELKKIAEKYKNDMEKRSKAQQELFKKNNVNMFSGCLLVFLQLPVFAGLYRLLAVDINLRQAPLIPGVEWSSNLAGPDMLWRWDNFLPFGMGEETGWFGPYLNVLPLITIVLFLFNQRLMTPPPTDEQTRMQHQVMKFMMIFMAVMFFKVPAGLCLYFIASSLWTLAEFKVLKKDKLLPPKPGTS